MTSGDTKKIFINEEVIGQLNYITITGKLEVSITAQDNYFVKELIFLSFTEQFKTADTITMQIRVFDVFNLMSALEEVYRTGVSNWKKFTDSNKSKNSTNLKVKFLNIKESEGKVYLNMNIKDESSEKALMKVYFEKYEIKSIIKTLDIFAKEVKEKLYKAQRAYYKLNQKKEK